LPCGAVDAAEAADVEAVELDELTGAGGVEDDRIHHDRDVDGEILRNCTRALRS